MKRHVVDTLIGLCENPQFFVFPFFNFCFIFLYRRLVSFGWLFLNILLVIRKPRNLIVDSGRNVIYNNLRKTKIGEIIREFLDRYSLLGIRE